MRREIQAAWLVLQDWFGQVQTDTKKRNNYNGMRFTEWLHSRTGNFSSENVQTKVRIKYKTKQVLREIRTKCDCIFRRRVKLRTVKNLMNYIFGKQSQVGLCLVSRILGNNLMYSRWENMESISPSNQLKGISTLLTECENGQKYNGRQTCTIDRYISKDKSNGKVWLSICLECSRTFSAFLSIAKLRGFTFPHGPRPLFAIHICVRMCTFLLLLFLRS
jgi:hypothetical protein